MRPSKTSSIVLLTTALSALSFGVMTGCVPIMNCLEGKPCSSSHSSGGNDTSAATADAGDSASAATITCTVVGNPHIGLGNQDVAAKTDGAVGDRARAKPYSALLTEYSRVLGDQNRPSLIDQTGGTFGQPNERWFIEPVASAVFIDTAFSVAFEGCTKLTGDLAGGTAEAQYAVAPTADSAKTACTSFARKFWSRDATDDEVNSCVAVAMDVTDETYGGGSIQATTRQTTAQRSWAYACASVLTATGFLTY